MDSRFSCWYYLFQYWLTITLCQCMQSSLVADWLNYLALMCLINLFPYVIRKKRNTYTELSMTFHLWSVKRTEDKITQCSLRKRCASWKRHISPDLSRELDLPPTRKTRKCLWNRAYTSDTYYVLVMEFYGCTIIIYVASTHYYKNTVLVRHAWPGTECLACNA